MYTPPAVALVGKLGHGKTFLLNKLTGEHFPSNMGARSCTRTLQYGYTRKNGILVVDTPGFCASDDVAAHIGAQKLALEGTKLSGIYIVVKYGRCDEMAEMISKVMSFIGDDDIRIIITFSDTAQHEEGYDAAATKGRLSQMLDVPACNIAIVGKETEAQVIETFIETTLHAAKDFKISEEQVTAISSLCVGTRKFNKAIEEVYAKIAAASKACGDITSDGKSLETDTAMITIQQATSKMVEESKGKIFRDAIERELSEEQQNLIYGKAGLSLSIRLKSFVDASNKYLTWDVTDISDARNVYKRCNHCGAIFNKTEGCDGETTCGATPGDVKKARPNLIAEFFSSDRGWIVQYFWNGREIQFRCVLATLRDFHVHNTLKWGGGHSHVKRPGATFESGCGATISWNTMLPVDYEVVKQLGDVELQRSGRLEEESKASFEDRLRQHEISNQEILNRALAGKR